MGVSRVIAVNYFGRFQGGTEGRPSAPCLRFCADAPRRVELEEYYFYFG